MAARKYRAEKSWDVRNEIAAEVREEIGVILNKPIAELIDKGTAEFREGNFYEARQFLQAAVSVMEKADRD